MYLSLFEKPYLKDLFPFVYVSFMLFPVRSLELFSMV